MSMKKEEIKHKKKDKHCCHCEGCPEELHRPMTEIEAEIARDLDEFLTSNDKEIKKLK